MSPERWEEIKNSVKKLFSVEEQGREDLFVETAEGRVKQGEAEFLIFQGSALGGRIKLQLQKKPKIAGKKYFYSHRQGDAAQVEYKFSDTEMVYTFKAYKWDEDNDEWKEIDSSQISNF